jgi:hypothetical protein
MSEYRRGILHGIREKLWHFHELCEAYPTRTFSIRQTKPPDDELCQRCTELRRGNA